MIIVVEGISAAGKTTWCQQHAAGRYVPENSPSPDAPNALHAPCEAARYWVGRSAERWMAAQALERSSGIAVCDTDPIKLHYAWCLHQIGAAPETVWRHEYEATRASIAERRLGFADLYLVKSINAETARKQHQADPTRRRSNFDLHLRLSKPLLCWYQTLAALLPGRVEFSLPSALPVPAKSDDSSRYDVELFDRFIAALPGVVSSPPIASEAEGASG